MKVNKSEEVVLVGFVWCQTLAGISVLNVSVVSLNCVMWMEHAAGVVDGTCSWCGELELCDVDGTCSRCGELELCDVDGTCSRCGELELCDVDGTCGWCEL